jgi:carotenoid cleavage oxygenase
MPRDGDNSDVRWFDVEPCYVFHPMNAYEDGDTIVLDRWTVDLADGKVRESRIDDRGQEFPRVDQRLVGKRHR